MRYLLSLSLVSIIAFGAAKNEKTLNQKAMTEVLTALKKGDRKALADLIRYPIVRIKPLPDLTSPTEFLSHYDEYFSPAAEKQAIRGIEKDLKHHNVRGTGRLTFLDGKIESLEHIPANVEKELNQARERDMSEVNALAKNYDEIILDCQTKDRRIRLARFTEAYKVFSWKKGDALTQKPEMADAKRKAAGSAGIVSYTFTQGEKEHRLSSNQPVCSEDVMDKRTGRCRATLDEEFCD